MHFHPRSTCLLLLFISFSLSLISYLLYYFLFLRSSTLFTFFFFLSPFFQRQSIFLPSFLSPSSSFLFLLLFPLLSPPFCIFIQTYRVFIKYCAFWKIFAFLCFQRTGRVQKNHKILRKNTIFNELPVFKCIFNMKS